MSKREVLHAFTVSIYVATCIYLQEDCISKFEIPKSIYCSMTSYCRYTKYYIYSPYCRHTEYHMNSPGISVIQKI